MDLRVASPEALADAAADEVAATLRDALADRPLATLAVSGGRTPAAMFARLVTRDLPWERVHVFQVDERVAPDGHPDRNLTAQRAAFAATSATFHPLPVGATDLDAAAAAYGAELAGLTDRLDCVHLGLGDDGHTASLVPGDPALLELRRPVAVTDPYQGRVRLTLTRPTLDRARRLVWLVSGASKREMVGRLLAHDPTIPAGLLTAPGVVVLDPAADPR